MSAVENENGSERRQLARLIGERCRLTGTFTLRSGQESSTYFDKYLFEADPSLLTQVAEQAATLIPKGTEVLAGLELGGVPVATALSLTTGLPVTFVRKEAKKYGTARLAEGALIAGKRTLVVEDVITTGGQVAASTSELRSGGALVDAVLCIIDRSGGDHLQLDALECEVISLLREEELG
ncbi:MAG: orotate phosphoribosyltransferase [Acidimicrobiales bacterium]|jgi:orotate phosphoribosyltransferase